MARLIRVLAVLALFGALAGGAYWYVQDYARKNPQEVPWTPLSLGDPVGRFTLRKIAELDDDYAQCRALLDTAGIGQAPAPPVRASSDCGYEDGIRLQPTDEAAAFAPAGLVTSCPVAAALAIFEAQVLQPAARRHLGSAVTSIDHAGSYSCRRLYGREEGAFSEHATADAVDITGFRIEDGTRVSVLRDWDEDGPRGRFLREVRDGACRLFSTTLSPDYNAAHADHLHLDFARRGRIGMGVCR